MTKEELKELACKEIDNHREEICSLGRSIYKEPELGFKEVKTSEKIKKVFDDLGYQYEDEIAITGVIAERKGKKHLAKIAVMAEMDAVISPNHPFSDKKTNAAHACGHNAMCASLAGVAYALKNPKIMENLDGDIALMAVPSEEYVELEYRKKLIDSGKIVFMGGKQEFIRLGKMDDVDMTIMQHTASVDMPEIKGKKIVCCSTSLGFMGKIINYTGKEAHAGGAPFNGINALNAANIGFVALNAQRETFKDEDHIRVHPIITKGGDIVNTVPADVRIETYVRRENINAIMDACEKTDRAFKAGGYAVGAKTEIIDIPGYMPFKSSKELSDLAYTNAVSVAGENNVLYAREDTNGSSDIGDISQLMPAFHGYFAGARGTGHGMDYEIFDEETAYITPAKVLVCMAIDLLYDNAKLANHIKEKYEPPLTKQEYLEKWGKIKY